MSRSQPTEVGDDADAESESFTGQGLPRVEDHRILTGKAEFIHDITPDNCLHMALVRSMHAHAEIESIETSEAKAHPDCELVLTAEDLKAEYNPMPTGIESVETEDGEADLFEWSLADEKARFVGEPVVAIVASNRYAAEDIADLVTVEYNSIDAVADGMAAREDDVVVHEHAGTNVVDHERIEFGDPSGAFDDADTVVEGDYSWGRISGVPLETAGVVARYDEDGDSFDIDCNIQLHTLVDNMIYETLGYGEDDVRVNVPADVGGSYGTKIGIHRYCCLAAMASQQLEQPVKFEEDRIENLQGGDMHCSDREYEMRMAVDDDGTIRGLEVWFVDDFGAYPRYPVNQVLKPLSVVTNSYDIEDVTYEYDLVLTNKTSQTAYRGFGVDPHIYALEMVVDKAAREIGMDPTEFRRRNMIQPEQMPYTLPSKNIYDSGDYPATLDRIQEIIDDERDGGLLDPEVVEAKREEGKYRGVQPSVIIEPGVSGSDWTDRQRSDRDALEDRDRDDVEELPEHLRATLEDDGTVTASLATDSSGQGHQTLVSQLLADELEILPSDIEVDYLDSIDAPTEYGSAASRMAVMLSGATVGLAEKFVANAKAVAADHWGVSGEDISYRDGALERIDTGDSLSLADLAAIDDADRRLTQVSYNYDHPATEFEEFDEAFSRKFPVYPTAAFGANAPIVEVDVETGEVDILTFHTVRDCGTMLNPMIVEGQAHGGIAQGIGASLLEEFGYEDDGQPQAITLFDYLLPSIENVPEIQMEHTETPSPYTETGAKGVGEGGMIDAPASIATSINAALEPLGIDEPADQIPVAPDHIRKNVRDLE
ncbi:xanthine dehydrogenase family protein molybdopterin-binding subunit [Halostagnicola sp. A-GB9-2]|uniref:xanthine dehydrogenase family protein molybdopterin-binding subunit n=1 Tax=Halostagnicola sp. A-GB9-2 TaxID=3048066 RepID=UPI0024BF90EE|nr:xanthine dehydrogenase family protein molybdopterin-binding subunit [Halostagnicola sp. A-GB9-2]MDJ1433723.1 xanthine dehydrogenase family protein molybdopterin-binding subunit [Halostagnicola sp. A-GB9-2]